MIYKSKATNISEILDPSVKTKSGSTALQATLLRTHEKDGMIPPSPTPPPPYQTPVLVPAIIHTRCPSSHIHALFSNLVTALLIRHIFIYTYTVSIFSSVFYAKFIMHVFMCAHAQACHMSGHVKRINFSALLVQYM